MAIGSSLVGFSTRRALGVGWAPGFTIPPYFWGCETDTTFNGTGMIR
jgi:hypothetical protein